MTQSEHLEKIMRDYQWHHTEIPLTEYLLRHGVVVLPCVAFNTHDHKFRIIKKNNRSGRVFYSKPYASKDEAEQAMKEDK